MLREHLYAGKELSHLCDIRTSQSKTSFRDEQVPEGFNPQSNFQLSLHVSYPNAADRISGSKQNLGDIFLDGNCVTIGCIPITDDEIKEVY